MSALESRITVLKGEVKKISRKLLGNSFPDPVFDGFVKDFERFDDNLRYMFTACDKYLKSLDQMSTAVLGLSTCISNLQDVDAYVESEKKLFHTCCSRIASSSLKHSISRRLHRDFDFNVIKPLKEHLLMNMDLAELLQSRRKAGIDFQIAYDQVVQLNSLNQSGSKHQTKKTVLVEAESQLALAQKIFCQIDKESFSWLYILRKYKDDILDSLIQTMKYLMYEFHSASAHEIHAMLPGAIEFRPMVEMTPTVMKQYISIISLLCSNTDTILTEPKDVASFARKVYICDASLSKSDINIDPVSIKLLQAQGFNEFESKNALKQSNNNVEYAIDLLVGGNEVTISTIRKPTTLEFTKELVKASKPISGIEPEVIQENNFILEPPKSEVHDIIEPPSIDFLDQNSNSIDDIAVIQGMGDIQLLGCLFESVSTPVIRKSSESPIDITNKLPNGNSITAKYVPDSVSNVIHDFTKSEPLNITSKSLEEGETIIESELIKTSPIKVDEPLKATEPSDVPNIDFLFM